MSCVEETVWAPLQSLLDTRWVCCWCGEEFGDLSLAAVEQQDRIDLDAEMSHWRVNNVIISLASAGYQIVKPAEEKEGKTGRVCPRREKRKRRHSDEKAEHELRRKCK